MKPLINYVYTAELEQRGDSGIVVRAAESAVPLDMEVELSAQGGVVLGGASTVPQGSDTSEVIEVLPFGEDPVTFGLESAALRGASVSGIRIERGAPLVMDIPASTPRHPRAAVTIAGDFQLGHTLTASVRVFDTEGLGQASFSYQWGSSLGVANEDIPGAIGWRYRLRSRDWGKTIAVRVTITDDAGNVEVVTSEMPPPEGTEFTVLVGEFSAGKNDEVLPAHLGYSVFGDIGGSLTPAQFEIDGKTYRVFFLAHASNGLWLGLDNKMATDFTLRVGDSTYRGSESKVPAAASVVEGYWWPSPTPDWFGDDPEEVSLSVNPGVPLGIRPRAPVTGYFRNWPADHNGVDDISFRIYFSESVAKTADTLSEHVLSVSGGVVSSVENVGGVGRIWEVSVTPQARDTITITIEADLDCGLQGAICTADGRRLFNRMELKLELVADHAPMGAPTISGTVAVGQTLTVDTTGITDPNGMTHSTFSYQWTSNDGSGHRDISGATATTYTLTHADEDQAYRFRGSFTDDSYFEESLTSASARRERPYDLTAEVIDGSVFLTWKPAVEWPNGSLFQVLRNRPELGEAGPLVHVGYLPTPRGNYFYTDTDVKPGVLYVYRLKGMDYFGDVYEASEPVEIRTPDLIPIPNSPASGAPTIGVTARVGETLTSDTSDIADADGMTNAGFTYRWIRNDGTADTDIQGASNSAYTLVDADEGSAIRVRVSFTDDAGGEEVLTSEATASVAAMPATLTAEILDAPVSHDGQTAFTFELRFSEGLPVSYRILRDHAFTVTGGEVTGARRLERDSSTPNIRSEITVRPNGDGDVTITLPATLDCADQAAICTEDGRKLSGELVLTVEGPG